MYRRVEGKRCPEASKVVWASALCWEADWEGKGAIAGGHRVLPGASVQYRGVAR